MSYRQKIYDSYVESTFRWRNDISEEGLEKAVRHNLRLFGPLMPEDRSARVLELGCGAGALLLALKELGFEHVHGVDISPEQVRLCRERGLADVECGGAVDHLRGSTSRWDAIVMSDVLEHLSKDEALSLLEACRDRLADGGIAVVKVPNLSNPLNLRTRYVDLTHEIGLTKESLAQLLRVSGLEVETIVGEWRPHPSLVVRWVFERWLWSLFRLFCRYTLGLHQEIVRGKNLIATARRAREESPPDAPDRA